MKLPKFFRKNEIAIYAIALMLVTAGYFNYTANMEDDSVPTLETEIADDNRVNIGDAELVSSNEVVENEEKKENKEEIQNEVIEKTNTEPEKTVEDYFVNLKLERDTSLADMISNYTKILEGGSISETQKSIAMQEITKINNYKNAISICENLLTTKGFEKSVVFVNKDSVNVVVGIDKGLEQNEVAQIQNIISREFNIEIENIHISEKNIK